MTEAEPVATFDVDWCRRHFPALGRNVSGHPAVFLDGPGGSQVPERVIAAVSDYLGRTNANHGGLLHYNTREEVSRLLHAVAEEA